MPTWGEPADIPPRQSTSTSSTWGEPAPSTSTQAAPASGDDWGVSAPSVESQNLATASDSWGVPAAAPSAPSTTNDEASSWGVAPPTSPTAPAKPAELSMSNVAAAGEESWGAPVVVQETATNDGW